MFPTSTRSNGVFTFAESPGRTAPDARLIWHADCDPGILRATAAPTSSSDPDGITPALLGRWLSVVADMSGEHVVLSDGWRHIRLDIACGSLDAGPVVLHYQLAGLVSAEHAILPLRRFLDLCRNRRFSVSLYPPDRRVARWIVALRVHDALVAGASQRDIARVLFGGDLALDTGARESDSLRSRVRRLVADARRLAGGGYRLLMHQKE